MYDVPSKDVYQPPTTTKAMSRCAYENCKKEPLNPAVPACDEHLCEGCRMGVVRLRMVDGDGTHTASYTYLGSCGMCSGLDDISTRLFDLKNND